MTKPKRRALAQINRPRSLDVRFCALIYLLVDRVGPPGWVWGVVGTLLVFIFICNVVDFFTAEDQELPK